ncbi:hypothetical protein [Microbacterium resistens]
MTETQKTRAATVDLWGIAVQLSITPRGQDESTRSALRRALKRRRRLWTVLCVGLVVTVASATALVLALRSSAPLLPPLCVLSLLIGLLLTVPAGTNLISAGMFHRLSRFGRRFDAVTWWVFLLLGYISAGISLTAALTALILDTTSTTSTAASKYVAVLLGLLAVLFALVASSASSPLISTTPKPRLYQAHGAQLLWTVVLIGLAVSAAPSALWLIEGVPDESRWVILSIAVPLGAGYVAALLAWHRKALARIESARQETAGSVGDVLGALSTEEGRSDLIRTLYRLEVALRPSPYRSQSPAAPPLAASFEICEIVGLLLWATGERAFPDSIAQRRHHPESIAKPFRAVDPEEPDRVLAAAPAFLRRVSARLFLGVEGPASSELASTSVD